MNDTEVALQCVAVCCSVLQCVAVCCTWMCVTRIVTYWGEEVCIQKSLRNMGYGVASISGLLQLIGLFCRIQSLL